MTYKVIGTYCVHCKDSTTPLTRTNFTFPWLKFIPITRSLLKEETSVGKPQNFRTKQTGVSKSPTRSQPLFCLTLNKLFFLNQEGHLKLTYCAKVSRDCETMIDIQHQPGTSSKQGSSVHYLTN